MSWYYHSTWMYVNSTKRWRGTHFWRKHKCLHKLPHGLTIVWKFSQDLHHYSITQCGMGIDMPDLCVALTELQGHDLLVDFLRDAKTIRSTQKLMKRKGGDTFFEIWLPLMSRIWSHSQSVYIPKKNYSSQPPNQLLSFMSNSNIFF